VWPGYNSLLSVFAPPNEGHDGVRALGLPPFALTIGLWQRKATVDAHGGIDMAMKPGLSFAPLRRDLES